MKNVIKIILAITVVVGMFNCGQINPTDEEIALCNENPDSCNIGDQIVLENGIPSSPSLSKDISSTGIRVSLAKDISSTGRTSLAR